MVSRAPPSLFAYGTGASRPRPPVALGSTRARARRPAGAVSRRSPRARAPPATPRRRPPRRQRIGERRAPSGAPRVFDDGAAATAFARRSGSVAARAGGARARE